MFSNPFAFVTDIISCLPLFVCFHESIFAFPRKNLALAEGFKEEYFLVFCFFSSNMKNITRQNIAAANKSILLCKFNFALKIVFSFIKEKSSKVFEMPGHKILSERMVTKHLKV